MIKARQLFLLQRYSAMLLAPLVLVHLVMIIIAVRNGLSAEEILARTDGNVFWFGFYFLFVLTVTVHAPIGVRNVLNEWTGLSARSVDWASLLLAVLLFLTGMRGVLAVT